MGEGGYFRAPLYGLTKGQTAQTSLLDIWMDCHQCYFLIEFKGIEVEILRSQNMRDDPLVYCCMWRWRGLLLLVIASNWW